jgi:hypothetical protein
LLRGQHHQKHMKWFDKSAQRGILWSAPPADQRAIEGFQNGTLMLVTLDAPFIIGYSNAYKTKKPRREDFLKRLVSIFSYRSLDDIVSRAGFSTSIPLRTEPVAKASSGLFPQPFFIRGIFRIISFINPCDNRYDYHYCNIQHRRLLVKFPKVFLLKRNKNMSNKTDFDVGNSLHLIQSFPSVTS